MSDVVHVLIRGLVGFSLMFILARIMGKKHISQITYYEYIVGISIGSIAAELTFSPHIRMANFIVGMLVWGIIPIAISKIELKSFIFRTLMEGHPTFVIKNGKILEMNLKKENVTIDELMVLLREKDVFKVSDIDSAILEKNGQLSVMKKSDKQPLTRKDVRLKAEPEHQPRLVIMDGNVMERSLNEYGYTKEWLLDQIREQGVDNFHDVFFAQIDSMGNVYVDVYNDTFKMPQVKKKLLATASIKQLQENLLTFSLQTENKQAKEMYQTYAKHMDELIDKMSIYLNE